MRMSFCKHLASMSLSIIREFSSTFIISICFNFFSHSSHTHVVRACQLFNIVTGRIEGMIIKPIAKTKFSSF